VDEVDELVKDVNPISLKTRPAEDVAGDESTINSSLKEGFASSQDCRARRIRLSSCQQHLVLGATPQG